MRFNTSKKASEKQAEGKFDLYEKVTEKIITKLSEGVIPWRKRWASPYFENEYVNFVSGRGYSAINRMAFLDRPGRYMTFRQIQEAGGHLKEGASSCKVVYNGSYIPASKKKEAEKLEAAGESTERLKAWCLRYYNVFHEKDIEGIEALEAMEPAAVTTADADGIVSSYCQRTGVRVVETATDTAGYDADTDTVTVPERKQFRTEEQFYGILFSLLASSTARADRCRRKGKPSEDGDGQEELACEMASAMLLSATGLETERTDADTQAECGRWIKALGRNYRLAVTASSAAEKAAKLILGSAA